MSSDLRVAAIAGGCALVISMLVAAISKVSFGILILRAIIFGVVFGAIIFGALWLLRRYTPELFSDTVPNSSDTGSVLNIVLPGDVPTELGAENTKASSENNAASSEAMPAPKDVVSDNPNDIASEVSKIKNEQPIIVASLNTSEESNAVPRPTASFDNLDTLPELDGLADSFSGSPTLGGEEGESGSTGSSYSSSSSEGSSHGGVDPALLAKAVQTVLKKDQKG